MKITDTLCIIGGAGYVGDRLSTVAPNCIVLDLLTYEDRFLKSVPFGFVDITKPDTLLKYKDKYPYVILLAGLVGDPACSVNAEYTKSVNIEAVKWIVDNFSGKLIFPSSCSVYGKNSNLLTETAELNPLSLYAESKVIAEEYILKNRPDSLIFRLGTLFGMSGTHSRPRLDLFVNILSAKAANGEILKVFGGEQWRPLLHVNDVSTAILHGISKDLSGIYNLSYKNYTIKEVAEIIVSMYPEAKIEYTDILFEDRRDYKVSNEKLINTGWCNVHTLKEGIIEISESVKHKRIKDINNIVYHNGKYINEYNKRTNLS